MCGIWAVFGIDESQICSCWEAAFCKIRHRGPDAWRLQADTKVNNSCIGFARLAIVDSLHGMQPMTLRKHPFITLICNGEIYNCKRLMSQWDQHWETGCDVEAVIQSYVTNSKTRDFPKFLDGVFAFVLMDVETNKLYVARDPYGVRPLFRFVSESGIIAFSSEAKGLSELRKELQESEKWILHQFPPGHIAEYDIKEDGKLKLVKEEKFYNIGDKPLFIPFIPYSGLNSSDIEGNIRTLLTEAVRKRLMAERRIGCLLSGGLDSSLIAALLVRLAKEANLPYKIQSFSIGMGSSPDLIAARKVAKFIDTEHHEIIFNEDDVARVLDQIVYCQETSDITTTRAGLGMYLICEYIKKNTNTTVIMSGEGADELAQGYIYFRDAPNSKEGHLESLRLLNDIYLFDGLRADRTTAASGLELRVPFLDLNFTQYFLSLPETMRQPQNGIEKYILRKAFSDMKLLPSEILWRHKEAFSDGVASVEKSLFEVIQEIVDKRITDEEFLTAQKQYSHLTPKTKEALYYRRIFEKNFPGQCKNLTPYYWMPKWINVSDPSARFIKHYAAKDE